MELDQLIDGLNPIIEEISLISNETSLDTCAKWGEKLSKFMDNMLEGVRIKPGVYTKIAIKMKQLGLDAGFSINATVGGKSMSLSFFIDDKPYIRIHHLNYERIVTDYSFDGEMSIGQLQHFICKLGDMKVETALIGTILSKIKVGFGIQKSTLIDVE